MQSSQEERGPGGGKRPEHGAERRSGRLNPRDREARRVGGVDHVRPPGLEGGVCILC